MNLRRFFLPLSLALSLLIPFARPAAQETAEARRARVERGLVPPVLLKGGPAWSIEERLRQHKIPGVSVAVIKDFKVEWARGYGVKDAETREPVTAETLFQAGSISKPVAAALALNRVERGRVALEEDINTKLVSW